MVLESLKQFLEVSNSSRQSQTVLPVLNSSQFLPIRFIISCYFGWLLLIASNWPPKSVLVDSNSLCNTKLSQCSDDLSCPSGLGNYFVSKKFPVQTLRWSLEFVIRTNLEHDTIAESYTLILQLFKTHYQRAISWLCVFMISHACLEWSYTL